MSLTASAVDTWEDCQGRTHAHVAVRLLELAHPETPEERLVGLSIGARDRLLLDVHDDMFGRQLELRSTCPSCDERLEITASTDEIRRPCDTARSTHELTIDDYTVRFRLPSSADVTVASRAATAAERYRLLWRRSTRTSRGGVEVDPDEVPAPVRESVETLMGELDSQAVSTLALECPVCSHEWEADFDIVPVLWARLDGVVRRRLHDVHRLAEAYGWEESTVLALGPARRQFYLGLL